MTGFAWGLFGAVAAVSAETIFAKYGQAGWLRCYLFTLPLQAGISFCIYQIVRTDSILGVPIYFGGATALLRIGSTLWLGSEVSGATWTAYGLTCLALVVKIAGGTK
jgi:hypothetical protein